MARPGWHGGVAMRTAAESAGFDRARHAWIAVALAASTLFAASSAPAPAQVYQVPPGANPQATEPAPAAAPAAGADDDADQSLAPASGPVMTPDEARIEVDVSTRSVAVTSAFTGTEIVVFGAVAGRKAGELEERPVDIVVIVEGTFEPLVVRRKSNIGGIWMNTRGLRFDSVPSYYTITSTRPIDKIAPRRVLRANQIGFDHVQMRPMPEVTVGPNEMAAFREAVIRLKKSEGLYKEDERGVEMKGTSLFRSAVRLPANVPVGPLATKVFLFRDGNLIARSDSLVTMRREGLEALIYGIAFNRPLLYGILTVLIAVAAGLAASAVFRARNA